MMIFGGFFFYGLLVVCQSRHLDEALVVGAAVAAGAVVVVVVAADAADLGHILGCPFLLQQRLLSKGLPARWHCARSHALSPLT